MGVGGRWKASAGWERATSRGEGGWAPDDGAEQLLSSGGVLYLYGPFRRGYKHTAPSNKAFDASLRCRDSAWGIRDMEKVVIEAEAAGFALAEVVSMPANNFSVVFRKIK